MQGLTGDATLRRPTAVCTQSACGLGHAPLDAARGLGAETLTPRLARVVARAGSTVPFADAAAQITEAHGLVLSAQSVRRVTEAAGAAAEAQMQEASAAVRQGQRRPPSGAPVLVVAVDGGHVPLVGRGQWGEMKVGRAAPLGPARHTDQRSHRTFLTSGPAQVCAGREEAEEFWWHVAATARQAGWGRNTRRVVVRGDGAPWIWARAADFVGGPGVEVIEILDWFHVVPHLWAVGRAVFPREAEVQAWIDAREDTLYTEGVGAVLAALDKLRPTTTEAEEVVRQTRAYLETNATRTDDPAYVAAGWPIGSGMIETQCKTLVQARLKGAGMRWGRTACRPWPRCGPCAPRASGTPSGPRTPCARAVRPRVPAACTSFRQRRRRCGRLRPCARRRP